MGDDDMDKTDGAQVLDLIAEKQRREKEKQETLSSSWQKNLLRSQHAKVLGCFTNLVLVLQNDDRFKGRIVYDQFSADVWVIKPLPWDKQVSFKPRRIDWDNGDEQHLRMFMAAWPYEVSVKRGDAIEAIEHVAHEREYHAVQQYLESVQWDGVQRIDDFFIRHLGAMDNDYTRTVSRKFFIQAIARAMQPGCEAHGVLVLEGDQRIGKSTILKILGGDWFSDTSIHIGTRVGYASMAGVWIRELPEFKDVLRVDPAEAKAFFTAAEDKYVPPYGRKPIVVKRSGIFAGTYNPSGAGMLTDPTGGGRYWPVYCHAVSVDFDAVKGERDQVWAEALTAFRNNEKWWITRDDSSFEMVWDEQESRYVGDAWEEMIGDWVVGRGEFTMESVLKDCLKLEPRDMSRAAQTRVGVSLVRLGFKKIRKRINGIRAYLYTNERALDVDF